MSDKSFMEVHVTIDPSIISQIRTNTEAVVMIPFGGTVDGELFTGKVLPGGVDTQVVNAVGVRHMSARYMLEGNDHTGKPCRIYIENNGFFEKNSNASPFLTVPTFITDSEALAPYLHTRKFRGEGHPAEGGVTIKFFEIL